MDKYIQNPNIYQSKYEFHRHLQETLTPKSVVSQRVMAAYLGNVSPDKIRIWEQYGLPVLRFDGQQPKYIVGQVEKWVFSQSASPNQPASQNYNSKPIGFRSEAVANLVRCIEQDRRSDG